MEKRIQNQFIDILKKEMVPAFGCTEPIALAFTAAKAVETLGEFPDSIHVNCSGNIIKNAKSVVIPNSNGKKGIEYSAILGAIARHSERNLEILADIDAKVLTLAEKLYEKRVCSVSLVPDVENLYIEVQVQKGQHSASVTVKNSHTNIISIFKDDKPVFFKETSVENAEVSFPFSFDEIYEFSCKGIINSLRDILELEVQYNMAIAEEGIRNHWGAGIGRLLLSNSDSFQTKLRAYAAAGSDARMSGCSMPVVINSGSGNQGITVSVPIIMVARDKKIENEQLYRALIFANLIGLYLKSGIGKLSAYCGVVSAAAASIAGVAFLDGASKNLIGEAISNALACSSGMFCDGAKPFCAIKIATALEGAFIGYEQAKLHQSFLSGDGIVKGTIDETIKTIGVIARDGMRETDLIILNEMLK